MAWLPREAEVAGTSGPGMPITAGKTVMGMGGRERGKGWNGMGKVECYGMGRMGNDEGREEGRLGPGRGLV